MRPSCELLNQNREQHVRVMDVLEMIRLVPVIYRDHEIA